jgi:pyruvate dehydrogenase E1 component
MAVLQVPPCGFGGHEGMPMLDDLDPAETREWVDALDAVMTFEGADRAFFLLDEVITAARRKGAPVPYSATTPYLNTIPPDKEDRLDPRELALDHRIRSLIRWNALAIVLRANKESSQLGGHIGTCRAAAIRPPGHAIGRYRSARRCAAEGIPAC